MALERLSGPDFQPCKDDGTWLLRSHMILKISTDLKDIISELGISSEALPYIMATYKLHKQKYRWLTNAANTIYSAIAHLITLANTLILESVQIWASEKEKHCESFLRAKASLFWLVFSAIEVSLNMPPILTDVYVADIARCFESIPLEGQDSLPLAVGHLIKIGFKQQTFLHPRSNTLIWIRIDAENQAARALWALSPPNYGAWFSIN